MANITISTDDLQKLIESSVHAALHDTDVETRKAISDKAKDFAKDTLADNCKESIFENCTKSLMERAKDAACLLLGTLINFILSNLFLVLVVIVVIIVVIIIYSLIRTLRKVKRA